MTAPPTLRRVALLGTALLALGIAHSTDAREASSPNYRLRAGNVVAGGSTGLLSDSGAIRASLGRIGESPVGIAGGGTSGVVLAAGIFGSITTSPGDADGDGVPDGSDNCSHAGNADQADRGGVGASSGADGIGDACQCGDVSGDGRVTLTDAVSITRSLLQPPTATLVHPERCDVGASSGCSAADAVVVRRALLAPPTATIQQRCEAANP